MTDNRPAPKFSRITTVIVILFLAAGGLSVMAGSATRTRPSGSGSSGTASRPSASTAGTSRPGRGSSGGTSTRVSGRARYGYGHRGYHHGGYSYYPGGWYGGYGWPYGYGWYGGFGWPYGYGWYGGYGPYAGARYRMVSVGISPDSNAPAVLEADIHPGKARLTLDGEDLGKVKYFNGNWDRLPLSPGQHKLVFTAKGYRTLRVEMEAEPGRFYRLDYRMEKGEGEDPRSMRLPRSAPKARTEEPKAGIGIRAAEKSGLSRGLLRVRVTPADAAVYLDGEFLGNGGELARLHGALPVAAGLHKLEFVRPGFRSETVEVDVPEGGDGVRVEQELERE